MNRTTYYRGSPPDKYGIYNTMCHDFQFGICEDTPMLAEARLFQKIGDDARKWRFEVRKLPREKLNQYTGSEWVVFLTPEGRELCAYTVHGMVAGEIQATKELLAYENGYSADQITTRIERRKAPGATRRG